MSAPAMSTATKLPKLRWVLTDRGVWTAEAGMVRVFYVRLFRKWGAAYGPTVLGMAGDEDGAKSIAQAFADSEAARRDASR